MHSVRTWKRLLPTILVTWMAACGGGSAERLDGSIGGGDPEVVWVDVDPGSFVLDLEDTRQLQAVALGDDGKVVADAVLVWTSEDANVAAVSSTGLVTGIQPGTVEIVATAANGEFGTATAVIRHGHPPLPRIEALLPGSVMAGAAGLKLVVTGSHFALDSVVLWGPDSVDSEFVSDTELHATVPASAFIDAGTVEVRVSEPSGTAPSPPRTFEILPAEASRVLVRPEEVALDYGQTVYLRAKVFAANGEEIPNRLITWTSDDGSVAAAFADGMVRANGEGKVKVKAWNGKRFGEALVSVRPSPVASVFVSPSNPVVAMGQSFALQASVLTESGQVVKQRAVTWTSDNTGIATVSPSGLVTGLGQGRTVLRARSEGKVGFAYLEVQ